MFPTLDKSWIKIQLLWLYILFPSLSIGVCLPAECWVIYILSAYSAIQEAGKIYFYCHISGNYILSNFFSWVECDRTVQESHRRCRVHDLHGIDSRCICIDREIEPTSVFNGRFGPSDRYEELQGGGAHQDTRVYNVHDDDDDYSYTIGGCPP